MHICLNLNYIILFEESVGEQTITEKKHVYVYYYLDLILYSSSPLVP